MMVERLDIPSQSSERDQRSLRTCREAVRRAAGRYAYLEIGSHLGGSLLPHVQDAACVLMWSIDPRPAAQPDARGMHFHYPDNSTSAMIERLEQVAPDVRGRLRCLDASTSEIDPAAIAPPPALCFVDGEHTDSAVLTDFAFCRRVLAPNGLIVFHDAAVVYNALATIVQDLDEEGVAYSAVALADTVFVIEFGGWKLLDGPEFVLAGRESYRGYLFSLQSNDAYRRLANRWPLRQLRRLRALSRSMFLC
jgi:hypothetical protein